MKKLFLAASLCAVICTSMYAQTSKKPTPAKTNSTGTTTSKTAVESRQEMIKRAKEDSIRAVYAVAKQIAVQMMKDDSIRKAADASAQHANKIPAENGKAANKPVNGINDPKTVPQKVKSGRLSENSSAGQTAKGAVSLGPSVMMNTRTRTLGLGGALGLEYAMGRKFTIMFSADYNVGQSTQGFYSGASYMRQLAAPYNSTMLSVKPELRFYPKRALSGFFIGPSFIVSSYDLGSETVTRVQNTNVYVPGPNKKEIAACAGLSMGVAVALPSHLFFELGASGNVGIDGEKQIGLITAAFRIGYSF